VARIEIRYEPPHNGWLTLRITIDGQTVEIDASDVPNNPIQDLLDAIRHASQGEDACVWLHLEPNWFVFDFACTAKTIVFQLASVDETVNGTYRREIVSIEAAAQDILMPFWRFLRKFQSEDHREPHWPDVDYRDIETVGRSIKLGRIDDRN
jgi:hypothetical protein